MRQLYAVLGRDVSTSLSPLLHTAAATASEIDLAYVPVSCRSGEHFARAVDALQTLGALGANVTIPFKAQALALSHRLSTTAEEIGAVNTLSFSPDGRIQGDNTDGPGLLRVLEALPASMMHKVQILGAGGAARAAAWALGRSGAGEVLVSARRGAEEVAALARGDARTLGRTRGVTLVVSALPPDRTLAEQALWEWIDIRELPMVLDLAYGGLHQDSPLVLMARAAGLKATDGRTMLVEQAALSLALWTGRDVTRLRSAMRRVLGLPAEGIAGI